MSKKGKLKVKGRKYAFGCQILKFEKKCFDWVCAGSVVTDVDDGYEVTDTKIRHNHHIVKHIYFKRPYDYAKNFLFSFTEFLSNIVSFFRVFALNLLIPAVIVAVVVLVLASEYAGTLIGIYAGVYGGLIALSLILAGLGSLWRKIFKLREKTDEIQVENGYAAWSDYEDDDSTEYNCA